MWAMGNIFINGSFNSETESLAWEQTDHLTYFFPEKDEKD